MSRLALAGTAMALLLLPVAPLYSGSPNTAQSDTGLIVGQVTDAATGRPIRGAIVTLSSSALVTRGTPPTGSAGGTAVSALRASTTAEGAFVFRNLPRGDYTLTASKPRYVTGAYGRRRPDGPSAQLSLGDGEKVGDVSIPMWKVSAIAGTITDERGEPIVGAEVHAFQRVSMAGQRRYMRAGPAALTDDRGMYRFAALAPGDYVVAVASTQVSVPLSMLEAYRDGVGLPMPERMKMIMPIYDIGATTALPGTPRAIQDGSVVRSLNAATPPSDERNRRFVYATTFYPSSRVAARATLVTTGAGDERTGIDIQLQPVATTRVSGVLTGPEDAVGGVALRLMPDGSDSGIAIEAAATTLTGPEGAFAFPAVPIGTYVLRASKRPPQSVTGSPTVIQVGNMAYATSISSSETPSGPPPATYWANMPVAIGRTAIANLAVELRPGLRVSGRIQFDGTQQAPEAAGTRIVVGLERPDGSSPWTMTPPEVRVGRDGQFELPGVEPGRYVVRVSSAPPGWTVRAVSSGQRELPDPMLDVQSDTDGITVSFTDTPAELSGRVRGHNDAPDVRATVVMFPTDTQTWTASWRNPLRFRAARARRDGSYRVLSAPPGEYFVIAIPDEAAADWQESTVLEILAGRAERVKISPDSRTVQDLTTKEVR